MKNLPNKIFLATTEEIQNLDNSFVGIAHSNPEDIIEPIEYIRKDVFVKKAVVWISNNCYIPHSTLENFRKYMEGE